MTKIVYEIRTNEFEIVVMGHAGYASVGNDIVCSAISILIQTLIIHLQKVSVEHKYRIESGFAQVCAQGVTAHISFKTILTGLEMLAEQYPEYISVKEGCTINYCEPLK